MRIEYRKLERAQQPPRSKQGTNPNTHTYAQFAMRTNKQKHFRLLSAGLLASRPLVSYSKIVCLQKNVKHLHTTSYSRCDTDVELIKNAQIKLINKIWTTPNTAQTNNVQRKSENGWITSHRSALLELSFDNIFLSVRCCRCSYYCCVPYIKCIQVLLCTR